ncbi:MAG: thiol:disulfide interchange protein DsbA/DsbL [Thiotrichales bacterium]
MRVTWTKSVGFLMLLLAPLLTAADNPAQTRAFEEGTHFEVLTNPVATPDNKLEVIEFFWYGCPHCYRIEPHVKQWLESAGSDVRVVRMPGVLNPGWALLARAYYAAEALGVLDKVHEPIFQVIHDQGRRLGSEEAVIQLVSGLGVEGAAFRDAMRSMGVDSKVRRSMELANNFRLTGVPAFVVAGKYRVINSGAANYQEMFQIVDFLLARERRAASNSG